MSAVAPRHPAAHGPTLDPHRQLELLVGAGMGILAALDTLGGHVIAWRAERRLAAAGKNRISATSAMVLAGVAALVVLFAWGAVGNLGGENAWLTAGPAGASAAAAAAMPATSAPTAAVTTAARTSTSQIAKASRKAHTTMNKHTVAKLLVAGGTAGATLAGAAALAAPAGAAVPAARHHASKVVHETLVIQDSGREGWPEYKGAANVKLPKDATVVLTIKSHDDGAASLPKNVIFYDKVMGTVGTKETVDGKSVTEVSNKVISHTFTIADLGINLPIPAAPTGKVVTVQATIHTGKAGTYTWQCYAPCGTGKGDMHGAMDTAGYMKGSVVIG